MTADGRDLCAVLVERGLAVPYDGGTKSKDCCLATLGNSHKQLGDG